MKIIQRGLLVLLMAACVTGYSCGPTDNKGAEDQHNSKGEGAVDSTRLTNFDSSSNPKSTDSIK